MAWWIECVLVTLSMRVRILMGISNSVGYIRIQLVHWSSWERAPGIRGDRLTADRLTLALRHGSLFCIYSIYYRLIILCLLLFLCLLYRFIIRILYVYYRFIIRNLYVYYRFIIMIRYVYYRLINIRFKLFYRLPYCGQRKCGRLWRTFYRDRWRGGFSVSS